MLTITITVGPSYFDDYAARANVLGIEVTAVGDTRDEAEDNCKANVLYEVARKIEHHGIRVGGVVFEVRHVSAPPS